MNKLLRFLSILAILIFASSYSFAQDSDYDMEVDGIYYKVNTEELMALVVRAPYEKPYAGNLTIPATVTRGRFTFNVVAINSGAFNNTGNLESVTILSDGTKGVFYIAESAFAYNTTLKKVVLPSTLQAIDERAFIGCTALQSIVIPPSVEEIGLRAFSGCSSLASITFPEVMPEKSIGDEAFYGCGITTLTLPKGVKQVGKEAFMKCRKLTKVNFADDYQVISQEMFAECSSLEEIDFPSSIGGMNSMAFYCCPLKKVVIPSTIKYMPWDAFLYCEKLTEFVILDSDEELGVWYADDDEDLTKLKTFYLGRNLNYIDDDIMTHLYPSQLTIGPKVTNIPKIFGDGIQEITSYIIDPTSVPENFSNKVKANAVLKVRPESYDAYCNAPGWKDFFFIEKFTGGETYVGIAIDEKNFPDPVFRQLVWDNYDKNHNGGFSVDEAALVTKLDLSSMGITNLKGIEYFTSLIELRCNDNMLTSLDLSKNTALKVLYCKNNRIKDSAMDELIASLPNSGGNFYALQPNNSGEQNIVTKEQITAAKNKGWTIYYYTGSKWEVYEGQSSEKPEVGTVCNVTVGNNELAFKVTDNNSMEVEVSAANEGEVSGTLSIPKTVEIDGYTYSVTSIGNEAFWTCHSLKSVTIGNSVRNIGEGAFRDCSGLTSVIIPNSVTGIGNYAFDGCNSLTSVNLPNSLTTIGVQAFYGCIGLTSVTIPNSVTFIDNSAFILCYRLTSIKVESGNKIYDSRNNCNAIIETASNTLIIGCKNTIIPNTVNNIGEGAFAGCSGLTSIIIPNSVKSIENWAFQDCGGLTSVSIPNSVTIIGRGTFQNCYNLTSVTIPNSVTTIGNEAFAYCSSLTSVTIPNSITTIGRGAFMNCHGLTVVTIGNSVTSIGNSAFAGCERLVSVTIGNSITSIEDYAFFTCISLKDVYCYAEHVPNTGGSVFYDLPTSATLHVPASSINDYKNTASWSGFGKIVALKDGDPSGVKAIKNGEQNDNAPVFNLNGQRVDTPAKGIYIKNGRKVLMK